MRVSIESPIGQQAMVWHNGQKVPNFFAADDVEGWVTVIIPRAERAGGGFLKSKRFGKVEIRWPDGESD